jgi:hypothetical protein
LLAEIERLKAEKLKALTLKISEKGCVSVHGLGRFPASLFAGQWERLRDHAGHQELYRRAPGTAAGSDSISKQDFSNRGPLKRRPLFLFRNSKHFEQGARQWHSIKLGRLLNAMPMIAGRQSQSASSIPTVATA